LKTPIGIFLLACLLVPYVGTYSWLEYQKQIVRKEVKERIAARLDKNELVFLKFTGKQSETELSWEHSREFEYKGEMYDVVEKEVRGDSVFFWCWRDCEETDLNRRIEALIGQETEHSSQGRENRRNLDNFSQSLYDLHPFEWKTPPDSPTQTVFSKYFICYSSIPHPPVVPPPERV